MDWHQFNSWFPCCRLTRSMPMKLKLTTELAAQTSRCKKDLFARFPTAIVIDSTYKTNRFNMPLVQIAGLDNSNRTFIIGNAFIKNEKIENYSWILSQLKKLVFCDKMPTIVSTDRDLALMTAVNQELPNSSHFLCRWHILKNVQSQIVHYFKHIDQEGANSILRNWNTMVGYSYSEHDFNRNYEKLKMFLPKGKGYFPSQFIDYIDDTWMVYKER